VLENFDQIKEATTQHFEHLYTQNITEGEELCEQEMIDHIPHFIKNKKIIPLQKKSMKNKYLMLFGDLNRTKLQDPNGFSTQFFKHLWDTTKFDLKRMLNYTLKKNKVGGATNSTFLALIPKETNPSNFSRFRPISLYNTTYKILTKIIANHIKPLLP
jgi:hypothetical protein